MSNHNRSWTVQTCTYRNFLCGAIGGEELCVKVLSFPLHTRAPLTWGLHLWMQNTSWSINANNYRPSLAIVTCNHSPRWSRAHCKTFTRVRYHNCKLKPHSAFQISKPKNYNFSLTFVCLYVSFHICVRAYVNWKVPLALSSSVEAAQWHTPSAPAWWTPPSVAPKGRSGKDTNLPCESQGPHNDFKTSVLLKTFPSPVVWGVHTWPPAVPGLTWKVWVYREMTPRLNDECLEFWTWERESKHDDCL